MRNLTSLTKALLAAGAIPEKSTLEQVESQLPGFAPPKEEKDEECLIPSTGARKDSIHARRKPRRLPYM
jgi:hypothetical protein